MTPDQLTSVRAELGRSALLYLSDHCPVGCAHCSVDATAREPRADPRKVRWICEGLNAVESLRVVGLSGGEPLADRTGLETALNTLAPRLHLVLYTSGIPWVRGGRPAWISRALRRVDTCVLSFSSFHARALGDERYADPALEVLVSAGVDVHLHVLRDAEADLRAARAAQARAPRGPGRVLLAPIPFLGTGRASDLPLAPPARPLDSFGPCRGVAAPAFRGDGHYVACCNEHVLRRLDDPELVRPVQDAEEVAALVRAHARSPFVRALREHGPAGLVGPADRARPCRSQCDACAAARHAPSRSLSQTVHLQELCS